MMYISILYLILQTSKLNLNVRETNSFKLLMQITNEPQLYDQIKPIFRAEFLFMLCRFLSISIRLW